MKYLYWFTSSLATFIIPILLVTISFSLNFSNAELHKSSLRNSDFYSKLSTELRSVSLNPEQLKVGFSSLVTVSVLQNLATPGWLQNLVEKNIDNFSEWLNGEKSEWILYAPSKDIENAVSKSIDDQTKIISSQFPAEVPTCTADQASAYIREGIPTNTEFCLPESVKSGQQTLSQFLGLTTQDVENSEYLDKLIRNNNLNRFNDSLGIKDLSATNTVRSFFVSGLNNLKGLYSSLRSNLIWFIVLAIGLAVASVLTAKLADRNWVREVRRLLWQVSTATLVLIGLFILTLGGSAYLTSSVQNLILPGLNSSQLVALLAFQLIVLIFNVFSIAFWIAIVMLVVWISVIILENMGYIGTKVSQNQKLFNAPKVASIVNAPNPTFDGQFRERAKAEIQQEEPINSNEQSVNTSFDSLNNDFSANTGFPSEISQQVNSSQDPQTFNNSTNSDLKTGFSPSNFAPGNISQPPQQPGQSTVEPNTTRKMPGL